MRVMLHAAALENRITAVPVVLAADVLDSVERGIMVMQGVGQPLCQAVVHARRYIVVQSDGLEAIS